MGNPVEFALTAGQEADVTQGEGLIEGHDPDAVIADKGYDSDALVRKIRARGAEAVIPAKKNRKEPRDYDKHLYKERNKVERLKVPHQEREVERLQKDPQLSLQLPKCQRQFLPKTKRQC